MATSTEVAIASTTVSSGGANTITFSSIPATYTDLRIVLVPFSSLSSYNIFLTFNGVTTTTYSATKVQGNGTSASSTRTTNGSSVNIISNNGFSTVPALYTIDVFSYAGATNKTFLYSSNEEANTGNANSSITNGVGLWRSTSAITSLTFTTDAGNNFASGTTATLYGIL